MFCRRNSDACGSHVVIQDYFSLGYFGRWFFFFARCLTMRIADCRRFSWGICFRHSKALLFYLLEICWRSWRTERPQEPGWRDTALSRACHIHKHMHIPLHLHVRIHSYTVFFLEAGLGCHYAAWYRNGTKKIVFSKETSKIVAHGPYGAE